jgi:uncharacterized cupin superfamily protein
MIARPRLALVLALFASFACGYGFSQVAGHIAAHSHKDRPTLEYVLQGEVVEIRNGVEIPHKAGEMVAARQDVSHWWENRGTVPVVLLPVDVFKP